MTILAPTQLTTEARFQLFLDAASDYAIFFTDVAANICEWSSGAEKIIGYTEAEALTLSGRVIFTAEDRARGAPETEMSTAEREGQANDHRWHVRKDGTRFFAIGRLVALKDSAGTLFGYAKILRDATPHKTLELALHASDQQFRATFAQAPVGMVLTALDGRIQEVNAAFRGIVGRREDELVGRELIDLTAPHDREAVRRQIEEILHGNTPGVIIEKRLLRADGSMVWVQNSCALLTDAEGRPASFIDLCQDITRLKLSEADLARLVEERTASLRDKTKQMESFCYTVAHDLRAPLRSIAGYADILREDFASVLPAEGLEYIQRIEIAASRLDRLISDLLGYTRTQQITLVREDVDLTRVVQRAIEQVRRESAAENATIELQEPLGHVHADPVTLEHVFLNLISNAVKFRREDSAPVVRIYAEDKGETLRVWVEDNGIGIDPRFKDRVFGMFERIHSGRAIPGTGVGLAIVATTMERLGGQRGVEPNVPHGSRFWLEFKK